MRGLSKSPLLPLQISSREIAAPAVFVAATDCRPGEAGT